jgi:hypothetical protein
LNLKKNKLCDGCALGKHIRSSFKGKGILITTRPLELIHIDLFGPKRIKMVGESIHIIFEDDITPPRKDSVKCVGEDEDEDLRRKEDQV